MTDQETYIGRKSVRNWLANPFIWKIPVYQRHYSWDEDGGGDGDEEGSGPLNLFWNVVLEKAESRLNNNSISPHYFGAILVDPKTPKGLVTKNEKLFHVVDGQQRLTTIQIALCALIYAIKRTPKHSELKSNLQNELKDYMFYYDDPEDGSSKSTNKLQPTNFDKELFDDILYRTTGLLPDVTLRQITEDNMSKSKIVPAFEFLQGKIFTWLEKLEDNEVRKTVDALQRSLLDDFEFVLIPLEENDEAQKVFESMNSTAKPLTTFDLIRNNVFYRAEKEASESDIALFNSAEWQKFEESFWEKSSDLRASSKSTPHIDSYISRMLVAKLQTEVKFNKNDIYTTYRKSFTKKYRSVSEEIQSAVEYVDIYKYVANVVDDIPTRYVSSDFKFGMFRFKTWPNKDFYPLIFIILSSNKIEQPEKQKMISLLESFVIRRNVSGLRSDNYNKIVPNLCKDLGNTVNYHVLRDLLLKSDRDTYRFPENDEVEAGCRNTNFYNNGLQRELKEYLLKEINNSLYLAGDERVSDKKLTLDHIMPQSWDKNNDWKKWFNSVYDKYPQDDIVHKLEVDGSLHKIGNITLLSGSKNARKSNRSWEETKVLLEDSDIKMNREIGKLPVWDNKQIEARNLDLAQKICARWLRDIR